MEFRYDKEADAIYVRLRHEQYAYREEINTERRIDYAADGKPIGVELLCASEGVDLRKVARARRDLRLTFTAPHQSPRVLGVE